MILLISSCIKEENKHPVPDISIYLQYPICINDIEYLSIRDIYGSVLLEDEGYLENGIIIINTGIEENGNPYRAYDATCPNEVNEECAVDFDEGSISLLTCPCCGSKFEVTYGAVNQGPANYPLKAYKTAFDGDCIRVYN